MSNTLVYGDESIPITEAARSELVIFDGKWTEEYEWKQSSLTAIDYDNGMKIKLRTSHYGDFIYVLIDFVTDTHIEKGIDMAMICFDGKNEKNIEPDSNDFCFSTVINGKNPIIYQGDNPSQTKNKFQKITHEDFIALGTMSDENDRYTKVPHTSYEFKIPIEILERSSFYGFYMVVYDSKSDLMYTWPKDISVNKYNIFSSPNQWGEIYSPDKSLPEFPFPLIGLVLPLIIIAIFRNTLSKFNF